jgi:hypothetical protein
MEDCEVTTFVFWFGIATLHLTESLNVALYGC